MEESIERESVIEASDSPPHAPHIAARSAAVNQATRNSSRQSVTAKPERSEFAAWAEQILQEIEHELSSQTPSDRVPPGITNGVTFFSDVMNTSSRNKSKDDDFPVWAQELLADLNQRPADGPLSRPATESDARLANNPKGESRIFFQPKCEIGRFPAWAEQLLSAVAFSSCFQQLLVESTATLE
ncbi:MAG: hypothetical protein WKF77_02655 [Planctomycetaceae bacterium]